MSNHQKIYFAGYPCILGTVKVRQMPQCRANPEWIVLTNHAKFDFNNEAEVQRQLTTLDIPKSIFTASKWAVSYLATRMHPKLPVKLKSTHHHENDLR